MRLLKVTLGSLEVEPAPPAVEVLDVVELEVDDGVVVPGRIALPWGSTEVGTVFMPSGLVYVLVPEMNAGFLNA